LKKGGSEIRGRRKKDVRITALRESIEGCYAAPADRETAYGPEIKNLKKRSYQESAGKKSLGS